MYSKWASNPFDGYGLLSIWRQKEQAIMFKLLFMVFCNFAGSEKEFFGFLSCSIVV